MSETGPRRSLWPNAIAAALALHGAAWLALAGDWEFFAVEPPRFSVMEAQLAVAEPPPEPEPPLPQPKAEPRPEKTVAKLAPAPVPNLPKGDDAEPPAPAAPPTAPVAAAPIAPPPEPYVEPDFRAAYLSNPAPAYPLAARRRGLAGKVVLRAEVTPDGLCADVRVERSSGHALLDDTALETVKKWRFVPAKRAGRAVAATVTIPINFKLGNGEG